MSNDPQISPELIEIHRHTHPAYQPLVDYQSWRVAVLNHVETLDASQLHDMQRHDETDEVFVLLGGRCILFLGEGDETVEAIHAVDLKPATIYNVKRGVWHNHTLTPDASVLVVENRDTTTENSPFRELNLAQRGELVAHTERLWGAAR